MDQFLGANLADVCDLAKQGLYDFIIVGSGMGGGVLARTLVSKQQHVLLIERGGLLFKTHCLNTSRPNWNHNITEGPSQANDVVFNKVKQPVQIVTADSYPYVGGPVHCLGGRSNVWGLYAPKIKKDELEKYFPGDIVKYLTSDGTVDNTKGVSGYDEAYQLMCGDPNATLAKPYPLDNHDMSDIIKKTCAKLECEIPTVDFACAALGAEFTPSDPVNGAYRIPQGAFSTVDWLLDRMYNKDELLTVLLDTEVIAIKTGSTSGSNSVSAITVRQNSSEQPVEIPTHNANSTILCAGSIDTAVIALRSGLQRDRKGEQISGVGKGLNDHSIWGSRIEVHVRDNYDPLPPLKLEGWWKPTNEEDQVLINIAVNANTFLGSAVEKGLPSCHYDSEGGKISKREFVAQSNGCSKQKNTVVVTFEYTAPLIDDNAVLNAPESTPVIRISSEQDETSNLEAMAALVRSVQVALWPLLVGKKFCDCSKLLPRLAKAGFGVVAHEAGTMRMKAPSSGSELNSVVDRNLLVNQWQDLFVCDMSVFPVSPAANPSLTLVALAQRLGKHLANTMQLRERGKVPLTLMNRAAVDRKIGDAYGGENGATSGED